jgi:subtilisin-like proprotein convertase family protein
MKRSSPGLLLVVCCLGLAVPALAQTWTPVDNRSISTTGKRDIIPSRFTAYQLDHEAIKNELLQAPHESDQPVSQSTIVLTVGLTAGTDRFRMVEYDMMEDALQVKYPAIKTYRGVSVTNPFRTIRADMTSSGFRAVIRDQNGMTYIDPYQRNDLDHVIVYAKKDFVPTEPWKCEVENIGVEPAIQHQRVGDCVFRSYRLAQATTAEYSNFFGATSAAQSALVMAQVVTATNRVNEVYEADIAVRLILVANTELLFYYNAASDPYNNGDGNAMLGQNQTTCNNVIGNANYDIGHVYSTGGGGVAYLGAVCNNSIKAGGVTGSGNPVGDPFYIDYVAHEMGHQFGANHTQNNNCNRVPHAAMEPGSASTIMGYAGICSPNVQSNSDAYFHAISLLEIANHINSTGCFVEIADDNNPPVIADVPNYTIPISTPFVLTASATDPDSDPLNYCWEQWDPEVGTMPPIPTSTMGPMFRSLLPETSPSRYFYNLPNLVNNVNPTWEELPSVSRSMEFRVTVRDFHDGMYGCTDEDNVFVTTTASAGPFNVTSQNSGATWTTGSNQTITWNVANTSLAPVSCATVDIYLSTDGGFTYPTLLVGNELNDGSATIMVPNTTTTTGRIMVRGNGNIFFDINNNNIVINAGTPNFTLGLTPTWVSECNDGTVTTTVNVGSFMGFNNPVTLTLLNTPPGSNFSFTPAVVTPGNTSVLTISNLAGNYGAFTPIVRGTSTSGNKDHEFSMVLLQPPTTSPTLLSPANNATDVDLLPTLDWQALAGTTTYDYQVALDASFTTVIASGTVASDQVTITNALLTNQLYYWRVRSNNTCGAGVWSGGFNFTTGTCFSMNSTNVPIEIPAAGAPIVFSTMTIPIQMTINDVNIINLQGAHSWVDDLKFSLIAPDGSERLFWDQPCGDHDNFNINFDDEGAPGNHPCPPINGLNYKPDNSLSFFDGKNTNGTWQMKVQDVANQDGGSLNAWGLRVCGTITCQLIVTQQSGTGAGSLPAAINCAQSGDTIYISAALANQTINIGAAPIVINKNVHIKALGAATNITGTGTRIFEVAAGQTGSIIGLTVTAGTSLVGGSISSSGTVRLHNTKLLQNDAAPNASVFENKTGGQVFVTGSCVLGL